MEFRPDHQRAVLHQQPFDRLDRHAGTGPWRGIARRHLAGIGKTGFECGFWLTVDHRHVVARIGEIIGRSDADDAAAENQNFHDPLRSCRGIAWWPLKLRCRSWSKDQATCLMASPRIETISSMWLRSTIRGGDIAKESPLCRRYRPRLKQSTMTS